MQNSAMRRPERERVVETIWILVLELDRPSCAAVQCLVNTEISRVHCSPHSVQAIGLRGLKVAGRRSPPRRLEVPAGGLQSGSLSAE